MPLTIEKGKVEIAALLQAEAEKQGVKLKDVRWWHEENAKDPYRLRAVNVETGRIEDARFSEKHLSRCNEEMKFKVYQKVTGLVIQLGKR